MMFFYPVQPQVYLENKIEFLQDWLVWEFFELWSTLRFVFWHRADRFSITYPMWVYLRFLDIWCGNILVFSNESSARSSVLGKINELAWFLKNRFFIISYDFFELLAHSLVFLENFFPEFFFVFNEARVRNNFRNWHRRLGASFATQKYHAATKSRHLPLNIVAGFFLDLVPILL